ncbi:DUF2147 domain-containing protein [Hymenobacter tibetensis]|uniref:DUF2147 domain-containing protein n=1 Tax=Hymenobacter tibetensis TaxID=497967 RepID=A0ABY4D401_9BACT|nr:DUF2147 domain-containing protein [Hymenobacter tibetensis]UOG77011.1 DUF2147 domain-containing protein [Hymenobacter tibetensis]
MKYILLSYLFFFTGPLAAWAQTPSAPPPLGVWADDSGDSHIELYRCGEELCGRLVWLRQPTDANGKPRLDERNPKEERRTQPLHNLTVLQHLRYSPENERWEGGEIYDPENGRTYSCYVGAAGKDRLEVKGYIGFSMIGKSHYWQRVK